MQIQMMKHDTIEPDPRNPRQVLDEVRLVELANDIAVNGLLQPLTVRPHPERDGMYMLVFGERRWRACDMIELDQVPVIVRDVDDLQALELQIAENNKRADVHPLEEADAFRRLHEDHGRDVDEIAELCGKSRAYIYAAMKLCALTAEPRKAFLAGELDKSRALLVARLPEQHQAEACTLIANDEDGEPPSFRYAQQTIRNRFMLRLADAPFDVRDASLVAEAGPCSSCEKRTGNQRDLFGDVIADERGGADVCTDSACYKEKSLVHWNRLKASASEKGRKVIEDARYTENGGSSDKKHLNLDERVYDFGVHGEKTYRELLGKRAEDAVAAVARTETGEIRELISRNDLPALLKEAGIKVPKDAKPGKTSADYEREQKDQRELERIVTGLVRDAALARVDDLEPDALWRLLMRLAIRASRTEARNAVVHAHELMVEDTSASALFDYSDRLSPSDRRNLVVELLIAEGGGWRDQGASIDDVEFMSGTELAADALEIDLGGLINKAKADLAAARAAKAEKKSKKAAPAEVES
jgi:ParB/RepB/Spo0J family partition protein